MQNQVNTFYKEKLFKTCSPKAGLLSVLPAPNGNPWLCPAGVDVPNCAPESVAVKLKPPDAAEFWGVTGAAPNVKVGAGIDAALTGKAPVFPKAKPVEAPPKADCVEFPNVGAAVLAGVPNVSGVTAVAPPTLAPNVKGLTEVGAWGVAKHLEALNTELLNVAWVTGVFDVMGVVLLAINPVKEVVAGLWPKVNVFWGVAGGAVGAGFKAPNCIVLVLLVVVVLVLILEEVAVDEDPPNWKVPFAALQLPNRDGVEFWVLVDDEIEGAIGWLLVSPQNRDGAGFCVLEDDDDDEIEAATGWLFDSPPNRGGVEFWVLEEDETEAAIVWLLVSSPNKAGIGFWILVVETGAATDWLLVWLPNKDWLGFCVLGTEEGREEDTDWVLVTLPNRDVLLWVVGTEDVEEAGWLNTLPKMGLKLGWVGLTSAAEAGVVKHGPKIVLNPDGVGLAVLLAGCAETVGAVGAQVMGAEVGRPKRLPFPRLSVVDAHGRGWARIWAKAEDTEEGAVETVGCGLAMETSDFTAPKIEAVEVMEEGAWATTDVAGAVNGITIISVLSCIQWAK